MRLHMNTQKSWKIKMRVLVTGGAGYIGSHTCVGLLNAEHQVFVCEDTWRRHKLNPNGYGIE